MEFSMNAVTRRQFFMGATALVGTLIGGRNATAMTQQEREASAAVTGLIEHILQVIKADQNTPGQEHRLMAAIESQTDLSLLARMTMGRYWRRATAEQQNLFVDVFRRYLLHSFTSRLKRYAGADLGSPRERFAIMATQPVGKKDIVVRSRIYPPSGAPLDVDWRLRSRGGRMFIIDLVVEGISLLVTQRSEFGSVLQRIGVDGLISELQARVEHMI